jgi:hypothetical protein
LLLRLDFTQTHTHTKARKRRRVDGVRERQGYQERKGCPGAYTERRGRAREVSPGRHGGMGLGKPGGH